MEVTNAMLYDLLLKFREESKQDLQNFKTEVYQRFDQVDKRFEQMDKRFDKSDQRMDRIEDRLETNETYVREIHASREKLTLCFTRGWAFASLGMSLVVGFVVKFL